MFSSFGFHHVFFSNFVSSLCVPICCHNFFLGIDDPFMWEFLPEKTNTEIYILPLFSATCQCGELDHMGVS